MKVGVSALLAIVLFLASVDLRAHHPFAAQYDADKPVTLVGTVTKVEWTNPHARFYVDVKDDKGVVTNWNLITITCVLGSAPSIPAGRGGPTGTIDIALVQAAVRPLWYAPSASSGWPP